MNRILIIFFPLWLVLLYSGCVTMEERIPIEKLMQDGDTHIHSIMERAALQATTALQERFNVRGVSR